MATNLENFFYLVNDFLNKNYLQKSGAGADNLSQELELSRSRSRNFKESELEPETKIEKSPAPTTLLKGGVSQD